MIDLHSHILPGIDDGPRTMEEAVVMGSMAFDDGIRKIVATPHIHQGVYDNTRESILNKASSLRQRFKEEGIDLTVIAGSEVRLTEELLKPSFMETCLPINTHAQCLLIEFPSDLIPLGSGDLLYDLKIRGFTPIISHPERNREVQRHPEMLREFVRCGAFIQVTAMSVTGGFGPLAHQCVCWLLRNDLVHIMATDAHSVNGRPPLLSRAVKEVEALVGKEQSLALVSTNPEAIIEGRFTG